MRTYVYKVIILMVAVFLLYQLTIGYTINNIQKNLHSSFDKETSEKIKDKIRKELEGSLKKERILNESDAILINNFFNKIRSELKDRN